MEILFFNLILLAVLAYGIHMPLLTLFVRKYDGLNISIYRNLSFLVTMLPLLFFTTTSEILKILNHLDLLFFATISAVIALTSMFSANKYLPIGLNSGIRQGLYIIFAFILGLIFFNESTSLIEFILISIILAASISLSLIKVDVSHLEINNVRRGFVFVFISGFAHSIAFFFFAKLSRVVDPLVATYFWESFIGVFALFIALLFNGKFNVPKVKLLPINQIIKITFVSLFTIVGTLSFSFAIKLGNFAIATSLMTTTVVVYTIMGFLLFKEKLKIKQFLLILVIILSVIMFKLFS